MIITKENVCRMILIFNQLWGQSVVSVITIQIILHQECHFSCQISSKPLKGKYINDSGRPVKKLVGISWRGGGRSARIIQKSVNQKDFSSLLSDVPGVRFVIPQYGESLPVVTKWRDLGIDVIHDENIDAMKDMKNWLSQVAACDAVLSIANTTIHGAGGLNKPTFMFVKPPF